MTNEEAKFMLLDYMYWHKKGFNRNVFNALCCALGALSEDSQPVVYGEWVESEIPNELYVCSNCGGACWSYDYERSIVKSNFCPNCGAKMKGDKEE